MRNEDEIRKNRICQVMDKPINADNIATNAPTVNQMVVSPKVKASIIAKITAKAIQISG